MKHILFTIILAITILISFSTCTPKEKVQNDLQCSTLGTIIDMTKLAGCRLMIELKDGTKLHPVEYSVEEPELKDGQKIRFSYQNVDAMTNCMAGQTVKITCIQTID